MRKEENMQKILPMVLAAFLFTAGCSAKSDMFGAGGVSGAPALYEITENTFGQSMSRARTSVEITEDAIMPEEFAAGSPVNSVERKLEKRAYIRIRAENLEAADVFINGLLEKHGAYTASQQIGENRANYTIRVPSSEYDAFLAGTNGIGRVLNRSENTEDVTLRYYDLEGRLAMKRELLKTFQSYLVQAKNIEEILSVETRIAQLQDEIDGTGRELRNLANRVDYATIDLSIQGPVTSAPYAGLSLGERIKELFNGFSGFLSGALIVLIGIVIYGIPVLLIAVFFFWLLFGRVGLIKKLWRLTAGKKT
jgi:hypothetical protein